MKWFAILMLVAFAVRGVQQAKSNSSSSIEGLVLKAFEEQNKQVGRSPALGSNKE